MASAPGAHRLPAFGAIIHPGLYIIKTRAPYNVAGTHWLQRLTTHRAYRGLRISLISDCLVRANNEGTLVTLIPVCDTNHLLQFDAKI